MYKTSIALACLLLGCGAEGTAKRRPLVPTTSVRTAPIAAPVRTPPLLVKAELDNPFVASGAAGEIMVRVRITTAPDLRVQRAPVNLGLVVDTSGSMSGSAIEHARTAAIAMVGKLAPGDRISVTTFNSKSAVLVPSTVISETTRKQITTKLAGIRARGTTDMDGGLRLGIEQVRQWRQSSGGAINRVVLLSDGNPNDEKQIVNLATHAQRNGITVTALGLGLDYNETLLAAVAQHSGGSFHYIDDAKKVAEVFTNEVIRMRHVVAQNMALRVLPGPGVSVVRTYGRAAIRQGRAVSIPLGTLGAGEKRDVMVRLAVPKRRDGATIELLDGLFTYHAKGENGGAWAEKRELYLSAKATADTAKREGARNALFVVAVARAEAAQGILDSIAAARGANLAAANAILDKAIVAARAAAKEHDDAELRAQAKSMAKLRVALPSLVPPQHNPNIRVRPAPANAPATVRKTHDSATKVLAR